MHTSIEFLNAFPTQDNFNREPFEDDFQTPSVVDGVEVSGSLVASSVAGGSKRTRSLSLGGGGFQENFRRFLEERRDRDGDLGRFVEKVLSPVEARIKRSSAASATVVTADGDHAMFKKPLPVVRKGEEMGAAKGEDEEEGKTVPTFGPKHVRWEFERFLRTEARMTGAAMPALMEISERFAQKTAKYLGKRLTDQNRWVSSLARNLFIIGALDPLS